MRARIEKVDVLGWNKSDDKFMSYYYYFDLNFKYNLQIYSISFNFMIQC